MTSTCAHRFGVEDQPVELDVVDEDTTRHGWVIHFRRCSECGAEFVRLEHHLYLWPDNGPVPTGRQDTAWTALSAPHAFAR